MTGSGRQVASRRVRLAVLLGVSALLLGATVNLVLVAEPAPAVVPEERDGGTFRAGQGAAETAGTLSWSFQVDPRGRRVVELDVAVPFLVEVTHVWGRAVLDIGLVVRVDGTRVAADSHEVAAEPRVNQTERVQRRMSEIGDMAGDISPVRVVREGEGPFTLVVDWSWSYSAESDAEVTFETTVQSVSVRPLDAPGVSLCSDPTCARILFVVALVAQGVAVWRFRRPPSDGSDAGAGRR